MAPHLPSEGRTVSPYSEGGALYALGLIHANHGAAITPFLLQSMRDSSHEVVQHGACLGLGLAALGTNSDETFEELKGAYPRFPNLVDFGKVGTLGPPARLRARASPVPRLAQTCSTRTARWAARRPALQWASSARVPRRRAPPTCSRTRATLRTRRSCAVWHLDWPSRAMGARRARRRSSSS